MCGLHHDLWVCLQEVLQTFKGFQASFVKRLLLPWRSFQSLCTHTLCAIVSVGKLSLPWELACSFSLGSLRSHWLVTENLIGMEAGRILLVWLSENLRNKGAYSDRYFHQKEHKWKHKFPETLPHSSPLFFHLKDKACTFSKVIPDLDSFSPRNCLAIPGWLFSRFIFSLLQNSVQNIFTDICYGAWGQYFMIVWGQLSNVITKLISHKTRSVCILFGLIWLLSLLKMNSQL